MTISTLLDANVLIDLLGADRFHRGSRDAIVAAYERGAIVISSVVWAELAVGVSSEDELSAGVAWLRPRREPLPFAAAFSAGQAHRLYRERGGRRERTLPDFLIGAHALVAGHQLLTRDPARYRASFPTLSIISPETHP